MINNKLIVRSLAIAAFSLFTFSCKEKKKKADAPTTVSTTKKNKKDSSATTSVQPGRRPPVINFADTIAPRQLIIYVKDSAATSDRISQKLADIYAFRLPQFILKNKIKITGSPVAWYKAQKAPFFFEAGLPIDKKPAKLPKGFFIKTIGGDSAVVAHFFGPYDLTSMAYEALNDFFKDHKKKRSAPPYEVYVADPFDKKGKQIDPYKVQTDIIFPY